MERRSFLISAAGAGGGLASMAITGGLYWHWQEMPVNLHYPGRDEGHFLRDLAKKGTLPPVQRELETEVVILGSGAAALTAAWKLAQRGKKDVLMLQGPQRFGNAAGAVLDGYACPTGAHYLPLPSPESIHIREMLYELGIILRDPYAEAPYYDERCVLHGPEERLLVNGEWQDGFLPTSDVPEWELAEHKRFFSYVERMRAQRGRDGRRVFVFPTVHSSQDPEWDALDKITLKQWLDKEGYRAPSLHWYLNYCCRDDYGRRYDEISAWAGLHYYCSRWGKAANASDGAWLTWPGGLAPLVEGLRSKAGIEPMPGTAYRLQENGGKVEVLAFTLHQGQVQTMRIRARKAICAMPLYVAARIMPEIGRLGFDLKRDVPQYAPWLVANFLLKDFPQELPHVPLSWDNVVYSEPGLGYVVSTHQEIRVRPPPKTVFTSYLALSHMEINAARKWVNQASAKEVLELVAADLRSAYGRKLAPCVERVEVTVRGHAMAAPVPGFRSNRGLQALREVDGNILFAHADLSGFSVFEEAAWWGARAAKLV